MSIQLEAEEIRSAVERLDRQVSQVFPGSQLARLCRELAHIACTVETRLRSARRPLLLLRLTVFAVLAGFAYGIYVLARYLDLGHWFAPGTAGGGLNLAEPLDALVNLTVLAAAAIWFLLNLEARLQQGVALKRLHELRSFAHAVDFQHLAKDTAALSGAAVSAAPSRYLEFCSDLFALIAKLAVLYGDRTSAAAVRAEVRDVELLTAALMLRARQKLAFTANADDRAHLPAGDR